VDPSRIEGPGFCAHASAEKLKKHLCGRILNVKPASYLQDLSTIFSQVALSLSLTSLYLSI